MPGLFPIQLVVDDGSAELDFGIVGAESVPFLWMNRFDVETPLQLEELWVLFPQEPLLEGADIEWVVFQDDNDDPRDGAQLHRASRATVQQADGITFSIYSVDPPAAITEAHVYLGVISRYAEPSRMAPTPPTFPAALDVDGIGGRSWVGLWLDDPPIPPKLPADDETFLIDDIATGHWMIRGFGRPIDQPISLEIPGLSHPAQILLSVWLVLAALLLLRRRPRPTSGSS